MKFHNKIHSFIPRNGIYINASYSTENWEGTIVILTWRADRRWLLHTSSIAMNAKIYICKTRTKTQNKKISWKAKYFEVEFEIASKEE